MSSPLIVLQDVRTEIAKEAMIDPAQVKIGNVIPKTAEKWPVIALIPVSDRAEWIDGDAVRRDFRFVLAAVVRLDESSADTQFQQLNDAYNNAQLRIEDLVKNNVNGKVNKLEETDDGIEWGGLDDRDTYAFVGSTWRAELERNLGT